MKIVQYAAKEESGVLVLCLTRACHRYLSQIADLEESVSRLTAHVASSDQDRATATLIAEHERLHQKEVAELEANISTLTEQDKIHRRRISELERKLHESTRSGTREQHEYDGSANET